MLHDVITNLLRILFLIFGLSISCIKDIPRKTENFFLKCTDVLKYATFNYNFVAIEN